MSLASLSLAVITLNEEKKISACLSSVPFAFEKIVVDSGSSDKTCAIAESFGAQVFERKFDDFSRQKNVAIEKTTGDWILLLDADETLSDALQIEIQEILSKPAELDGYFIERHNFLFGGRMKHGANHSDWQLRLIRRGKGQFEGQVHERVVLAGKAGYLKQPMIHVSYQTLEEYQAKFPQFSSLDALRMVEEGKRPTLYHLTLKPIFHFIYYYFFRLGFMDGTRGLLYHLLAVRYLFVKYWTAHHLFGRKACCA